MSNNDSAKKVHIFPILGKKTYATTSLEQNNAKITLNE